MQKNNMIAAKAAFFAAALGLTLTGCSSDDELAQSFYPADNIVRIDAGVDNMATRASVETATLSEMGFSIANAANGNYSYNNRKVAKTATAWTPDTTMLWQSSRQPVTVIAYAPYDKDLKDSIAAKTDYELSVAQNQTDSTYESDFLVYKKKDFVPDTELDSKGAVPIAFSHALSQLEIKVVFGTELDSPEPLTKTALSHISVLGTAVKGKCDFTQDTPVVTAIDDNADSTPVQPYEVAGSFAAATTTDAGEVSNASVKYACILIPQSLAAGHFAVVLVINDKPYVWTSTEEATLEGGNKYSLTLTVGKDYVVAGDMKATPWEEADPSSYEQNIETD